MSDGIISGELDAGREGGPDGLAASRELDARVAVEVMRVRLRPLDKRSSWPGLEWEIEVRDGVWSTNLPHYSTEIAAAWEVVERLGLSVVQSEDGWYAIKPDDIDHNCVRGTDVPRLSLIGTEDERWEPAATAPLAICIAALNHTAFLRNASVNPVALPSKEGTA